MKQAPFQFWLGVFFIDTYNILCYNKVLRQGVGMSETETINISLQDRLELLEQQVKELVGRQNNILQHLRELISTLAEIQPDYYEE